jgi:surface polysaccharide O-acyltransferase-like enzyme
MSRFLQYIHNLRGLAIIFVVGVHAGGYATDWISHPTVHHFFQTFFDPSEGNGTVLFLFIGGFLFQHLTHNQFDYRKYLEQKFLNIILPYIIISIPLILIRLNTPYESLSLPEGFQQRPHLSQFFYHLIRGTHMPPFWFISTIVLFYLSSPLLHLADNRTFYTYIFPLILLTCFFTYRPEHNANPIYAYFHFIPIYILGMWASYNRERLLMLGWKLIVPFAIVYLFLTVRDLAGYESAARELSFEQVVNGPTIVFNIYMFKAVVLCLLLLLVFYKLRDRQMPLLDILGQYSFGVFFVHYILISVTRKLFERTIGVIDFTLTSYLIYFMIILMLSIVTVYLVKKLTGRYSRYLIGS